MHYYSPRKRREWSRKGNSKLKNKKMIKMTTVIIIFSLIYIINRPKSWHVKCKIPGGSKKVTFCIQLKLSYYQLTIDCYVSNIFYVSLMVITNKAQTYSRYIKDKKKDIQVYCHRKSPIHKEKTTKERNEQRNYKTIWKQLIRWLY